MVCGGNGMTWYWIPRLKQDHQDHGSPTMEWLTVVPSSEKWNSLTFSPQGFTVLFCHIKFQGCCCQGEAPAVDAGAAKTIGFTVATLGAPVVSCLR